MSFLELFLKFRESKSSEEILTEVTAAFNEYFNQALYEIVENSSASILEKRIEKIERNRADLIDFIAAREYETPADFESYYYRKYKEKVAGEKLTPENRTQDPIWSTSCMVAMSMGAIAEDKEVSAASR